MSNFRKILQDFRIAKKEADRFQLEKCTYRNECNFCSDPRFGSYADMSYGYEIECNYIICGKCVLKSRDKNNDNMSENSIV